MLSEMIAQRQRDGDAVVFEVTQDWTQGRTVFGGLIAALGVQTMRDIAGSDWPLRAVQVNFVAPVEPGSVRFVARLLRQGKNVRQVQCHVEGPQGTAAVLVGVFGMDRESELPRKVPQQPVCNRSVEQCERMPYFKGVSPAFMQQIGFYWAEGGLPFSGSDTWQSKIWLDLQDPALDRELCTVMLTDAPPTPLISRFNKLVMSSSVSWALELRVPNPKDVHTGGFWRVDIDNRACGGGYSNEQTVLWTPEGNVAAFGYQVMAVFG